MQSSTVYDYIIQLRQQYPDKKLYAVCGDACASGAYYMASASDAIYANKSSIVGSIGVVMNGFGFVDTLHKLGVERRLVTSGKNKAFMDSFSPQKANDIKHTKEIMNLMHHQFIEDVKRGRGKRLKSNPDLFSGLIWTGEQARQLGLIDDFGDINTVSANVIKQEKIIDYTYSGDLFQRISHGMTREPMLSIANYFGLFPSGIH